MKNGSRVLLAFFLLLFVSCDQIKSLTNLFSKDSKITEKKSDKKSKKKKESKEEEKKEEKKPEAFLPSPEPATPEPAVPEPAVPEPAVPGTAETVTKEKPPQEEPPSPPRHQILIESLAHFAGAPTALDADSERIYVGYGNKLAWYDHELSFKGGITLDSPLIKIQSRPQEGGFQLFVTEEGNTLEIVEIKTTGEIIVQKTLEAEGPFVIAQADQMSPPQLFIFLSDRIQVLDLANFQTIQVKGEIPLNRAREAYLVGASLFVLTEKDLHVVNLTSLEIRSTISLGQKFSFLGKTGFGDSLHLVLGVLDAEGDIRSVQRLLLNPQGEGIADLGVGFDLPDGVGETALSSQGETLYFLNNGQIQSFDFKTKQIQPVSSSLTGLDFIRTFSSLLFVASNNYLARWEPVVTSPPSGKSATDRSPTDRSPAPLAVPPAGSSAVVATRPGEKKLLIAGQVDFVGLPGGGALLASHNPSGPDDPHPPFFLSKNFSKEGEPEIPVKNPGKGGFKASLARPAGSGWIIWDGFSRKIFFLAPDPPLLTDLRLPPQNVLGIDVSSDGKQSYLFISAGDSAKKLEALQVYSLDLTRKTARLLGKTDVPEIGGVRIFGGGKKAVVACGSQGICFLEGNPPKTMMKEIKKTAPPKPGDRAVEVALSPDELTGFVFFESADSKPFIALIDLKSTDPALVGSITNLALNKDQFRGLTFSAGGGRLLLPNDQGLAVYNVKTPGSPRLEYLWPVGKTYSADVTQRGQVVCAALGERGVECGAFP